MITGFNTDIQFGGVTYHVQTEDKGLDTPLILSLVYVGGTIIASKRTPYADLVETGYDEGALTERLQRQHKLICAAIRAGRVEDLKKMGGPPARKGAGRKGSNGAAKAAEPAVEEAAAPPSAPAEAPAPPPAEAPEKPAQTLEEPAEAREGEPARAAAEVSPAPKAEAGPEPRAAEEAPEVLTALPVEVFEPEAEDERLYLNLLEDEGEFRAGQLATIKVQVGRGAYGHRAAADASVTIKVLGTSFRPLILSTRTDREGVAVIRALLPRFTSGRAAIIIRASAGPDVAELRRIIHQY
ncbi:MAG TPA: hypothetical protein VG148_18455 [Pyrinomonadaceae bacterium]|nr:hypothetical protein [Pyrinomonadaceae bacterium]